MPDQLFVCGKRQGCVPEAGIQATTGNFLLSGNPDDSDFHEWNAEDKVFREYYLKRVAEGKNKQQALICIARRLVNIVYGMLKNHTEYREPEQ